MSHNRSTYQLFMGKKPKFNFKYTFCVFIIIIIFSFITFMNIRQFNIIIKLSNNGISTIKMNISEYNQNNSTINIHSIINDLEKDKNNNKQNHNIHFNKEKIENVELKNTFQPLIRPWNMEDLKCIGFRATKNDSDSTIIYTRSCNSIISIGFSGYCEVQNLRTNEKYKVMKRTSYSKSKIICNDAILFMNYQYNGAFYKQNPIPSNLYYNSNLKYNKKGIIMTVYHDGRINAYIAIRMIRQTGCTLPIELWSTPYEIDQNDIIIQNLIKYYNVQIRLVADPSWKSFFIKIYALFYTDFDQVLLLDSDNLPVRDPTYLFETKEYIKYGAIFWPDFWHPGDSIFHVDKDNLIWELLGINYINEFEQETGQIVIHRQKNINALHLLLYYSKHFNLLKKMNLIWGDKDLFRLAWKKTNTNHYYIIQPPSIGGRLFPTFYCGIAMIQHDPNNNILFIHRNTLKFNQPMGQTKWITHIQIYNNSQNPLIHYHLYTKSAFGIVCYGRTDLYKIDNHIIKDYFSMKSIEELGIKNIEIDALNYMNIATKLIQQEFIKNIQNNKIRKNNINNNKMNYYAEIQEMYKQQQALFLARQDHQQN